MTDLSIAVNASESLSMETADEYESRRSVLSGEAFFILREMGFVKFI